jgi:hypothetical protein
MGAVQFDDAAKARELAHNESAPTPRHYILRTSGAGNLGALTLFGVAISDGNRIVDTLHADDKPTVQIAAEEWVRDVKGTFEWGAGANITRP